MEGAVIRLECSVGQASTPYCLEFPGAEAAGQVDSKRDFSDLGRGSLHVVVLLM